MLKQLYLKYKWYIIFIIPVSILLGMANMCVVAIISDAIGNGLENMQFSAIWFFSTIGVLFLLGALNEYLRATLFAKVTFDIQDTMIGRVAATPLARLEVLGLSKVVATLSQDITTAVKFFHVIPVITVNTAIVVFGLAYMAYLSIALFFLVCLAILVTGISITMLVLSTKKKRVTLRELIDEMMQNYQSLVLGAKELALSRGQKTLYGQSVNRTLTSMQSLTRSVLAILAFMEQWAQFALFAILGAVVFFASRYFSLAPDVVVGYVIAVLFLLEPIEVIITSSEQIIEARVAFEKIDKLELSKDNFGAKDLLLAPPVKNTFALKNKRDRNTSLVLDNVSYSYFSGINTAPTEFALGPISIAFHPGEITFIVGGNGSGKSTLIKVLSGLYHLQYGSIVYNGTAVDDKNLSDFRDNHGLISADFFLFKHMLDADGQPCPSELLEKSIAFFGLDKKVRVDSESTISTTDLSQGQRKRLALIRLMFEDKPIVLLDEWAADQDPAFKKVFYEQILQDFKKENKILIVITHDDNYFHTADRILKMDAGQLIDCSVNTQHRPERSTRINAISGMPPSTFSPESASDNC